MTDAVATIELRVREVAQLFNSFDPSPFHERDLDDDAEEFIVSWARDLPSDRPIRIVVHLPEAQARLAEERGLPQAISHHFDARATMAERERREEMRIGRRYLWVGAPVLGTCLVLSQLARAVIATPGLAYVAQESLIIFGWVACWKAIET